MARTEKPKDTSGKPARTRRKPVAAATVPDAPLATKPRSPRPKRPSATADQLSWLGRGMEQPGGKLPLFDQFGQRVKPKLVEACIRAGWAERWFDNPLKPDWLVCRLTVSGRDLLRSRRNVVSLTASGGLAAP